MAWDFTEEELKRNFKYDPMTGIFSWLHDRKGRWGIKAGDEAGSILKMKCGKRYVRIQTRGVYMMAHRAAFLYMMGYLPDEVDHDDGDGTNNKWYNLKESTRKLNALNLRRRDDNTSGVTGVTWQKDRHKWMAHIHINGKMKNLGRFDNMADAINTRKSAELFYNFNPNHGSDRPL